MSASFRTKLKRAVQLSEEKSFHSTFFRKWQSRHLHSRIFEKGDIEAEIRFSPLLFV